MALAPNFPTDPYVYVLYTYDHELGSSAPAPRWGTPGVYSDPCPTPPGATADGCVVSGRLSRLQAGGQRHDRHRAGAGRGLVPAVPEPLGRHGRVRRRRRALRQRRRRRQLQLRRLRPGRHPAQPLRRPAGRGRRHPDARRPPRAARCAARTCAPPATRSASTAPSSGSTRPPARRCRTTRWPADHRRQRPADHRLRAAQPVPLHVSARAPTRLWVGDVGWNDWEEINRIAEPDRHGRWRTSAGPATRASGRQSGYDGANLNVCENLYASPGAVTAPYFAYHHSNQVVADETCPTGSSSIAGLAVRVRRAGSSYPAEYDGALFFADYSRDCIWVDAQGRRRPPGSRPDPDVRRPARPTRSTWRSGRAATSSTSTSTAGRSGASGTSATNQPPTAVASATPTTGAAPLTVDFDGTGSSDPDRRPAHLRLGPRRRRRLRRLHARRSRPTPTPPPGPTPPRSG